VFSGDARRAEGFALHHRQQHVGQRGLGPGQCAHELAQRVLVVGAQLAAERVDQQAPRDRALQRVVREQRRDESRAALDAAAVGQDSAGIERVAALRRALPPGGELPGLPFRR